MPVDEALTRHLFHRNIHFIELTNYTVEDFVIVTASNAKYYKPSLDTVATVQKHFPKKMIIYYDLGLHPEQAKQVYSIHDKSSRNVPTLNCLGLSLPSFVSRQSS